MTFEAQAHAIPSKMIQDFIQVEQKLFQEDRKFMEWKESRNDLEAYSYDMRKNLDGIYKDYCEESVRTAFLKNLNDCVEWLYAGGESAALAEYTQRLTDFHATGEPIKKRYRYYTGVPDYLAMFEQVVATVNQMEPTVEHLTDEQRKTIHDKVQVARNTFDLVKAEMTAKAKW